MSSQQTKSMSPEEKKAAMQKGREEAKEKAKQKHEAHVKEVTQRVQRDSPQGTSQDAIKAKVDKILAIEDADEKVKAAQEKLADAIILKHKLTTPTTETDKEVAKLKAKLEKLLK